MAGIRAQRKAERPGEILEAAFAEFVQHGYSATRLEDVAARAGVTKGTIYFYFDSKERVFEEVITTLGRKPIIDFNDADAGWTEDLAADLSKFLDRLYRFCADDERSREIFRLLIAEANRFPALVDRHFEEFMGPVVERLRERFAAAIRTGAIPFTEIDELPEVVLGPILALTVMIMIFANRRPIDPDRYLATHRAVLLDGLLARRGPEPAASGWTWTPWRPYPDPREGGTLAAPLGPGLYDLRLGSGEPLVFGACHSVVGRLATLVTPTLAPTQRRSSSRRRFLAENLAALEYRTRAAPSYPDALAAAAALDERSYRFGRAR